ncbi:hypothetical protein NDU88_007819 [Pleurodeles waltl]|uniref:Uncharacterized protein n=1 Tax=Pleurodeles waltl TaxID=8319 RepID=A0AAV7QP36_PLEWA|nr:hypothetical protein NDU88_007819 [Pleurodeles waltl]
MTARNVGRKEGLMGFGGVVGTSAELDESSVGCLILKLLQSDSATSIVQAHAMDTSDAVGELLLADMLMTAAPASKVDPSGTVVRATLQWST